ncbi:MAG TPA: hypothetical protein VIV58_31120 [Kofleriaceae bacterium]
MQTCADYPQLVFAHGAGSTFMHTMTVAQGGAVDLELECILPDLPGSATWDLPTSATVSNDAVTADEMGSMLRIHGVHEGTATVAIGANGAAAYGSIEITVAPVDHLALDEGDDKVPTSGDVAFAKEVGTLEHVKLETSTGTVLTDDDQILTPPPGGTLSGLGPGFFDIAAVPVGDDTVAVTSGGMAYSVPFSVVDHADTIALFTPGTTIPANGTYIDVCFAATLGSKFVTGLLWSATVDGAPLAEASNCGRVSAVADQNHDGNVTFAVTAGGVSAQIDIPIH